MTLKRCFDVALSGLGLIVLAPIMLVCALRVRQTSPGPAIFRQVRIGRNEQPFTCLKLRTMYIETPNAPSHHVSANAATPLGAKLRRYKIDELPQLINVLRGDMSLVGPRPCLPTQTELIVARRNLGLNRLQPGITGVSQVAGVDMSEPVKLATLDATYLDQMSILRDVRILWATVRGAGRGDRTRQAP